MTMEDGSEMPMPQAWPIATARKATAVGRRDRRGDEGPTPVLVTLRAPPGGCADHPGVSRERPGGVTASSFPRSRPGRTAPSRPWRRSSPRTG
jgi:hypothetical protein